MNETLATAGVSFFSVVDMTVQTTPVQEAFAQLLRRGEAVLDPAAWVWSAAFRIAAAPAASELPGCRDCLVPERSRLE